MKLRLATPALLMAGLLLFAACGDDDDDSGTDVLGGSATTEAEADASASDTDADAADDTDTTEADDTDATVDDDSSSDDSTGDVTDGDFDFSGDGSDDFCDSARDARDEVDLDNLGDSTADPADIEENIKKGRDALDNLADEAPDEIQGDVENVAEFFGRFDDLLSEYDYDFSKMIADAQNNPEPGPPRPPAGRARVHRDLAPVPFAPIYL
jgi:hypothetical protein